MYIAAAARIDTVMTRVLHIVCFSELYGTQRSILSVVKNLDRSLFKPLLASPESDAMRAEAKAAGTEYFPVPLRGISDISSAMILRKIIKANDVGLVHCHLGISSFLGLLAARAANVPAVVTRHFINDRYTTISSGILRAFYTTIYAWMNAGFEKTICVSEAVCGSVTARENIPAHKTVVIHNGVDLSRFRADARSKRSLDSSLERRRVVCISRLSPEKGLESLIDAVAICRDEGVDFDLIIAGSGPLDGELRQRISQMKLDGRVHLPGFVEDIPSLLETAHVFVLPAVAEPFGISLIEAMAAGIPSIATAAGGPLEIIRNGIDGILVPPVSPRETATAISRLLADTTLASSLSSEAVKSAARFDEKTITNEIQEVYLQVLNKRAE